MQQTASKLSSRSIVNKGKPLKYWQVAAIGPSVALIGFCVVFMGAAVIAALCALYGGPAYPVPTTLFLWTARILVALWIFIWLVGFPLVLRDKLKRRAAG